MATLFRYSSNNISLSHGVDENPDPAQYRVHAHTHAELFYFMQGSGSYQIEGASYALEPGDVLVIRPAESHFIKLSSGLPYERSSIHLNLGMLQAIDPEGLLLKPFLERKAGRMNLYKSSEFRLGSKLYWDTMLSDSGDPGLNIVSGMLPMLNEIYQIYLTREPETDAPVNTLEYQIVHYVNNSLFSELKLDDICEKFFISKSQLFRIFKKATVTTIWQYVTLKRLARARTMLRDGEKPTYVYAACGFNDYSAFYRAYVKRYGHSPNAE